jgi:hypothetical protein
MLRRLALAASPCADLLFESAPLPCQPSEMLSQERVGGERLRRESGLGQFHFRIGLVDAIVTVAAEIHATRELRATVQPSVPPPAMHFPGDQVVKSEGQLPAAERARAPSLASRVTRDIEMTHVGDTPPGALWFHPGAVDTGKPAAGSEDVIMKWTAVP